jgi:CRISPR system Cascade subunit CasE
MSEPSLHLWRLAIDPARLAAVGRSQRIPAADDDHGYTIHALLCGLFGRAGAPKPWHFDQQHCVLWTYAPIPLDPATAALADPLYHATVDWSQSASRPVPSLPVGRHLDFTVRVCPVVRHGGRGDERAAEHDVLLWQARQQQVAVSGLDPAEVYATWLRERAWPSTSGARLLHCRVTGWRKPRTESVSAWRGRGDGGLRLPDVTCTGTLEILEPTAWMGLLARGLGRHRAFGYGMLLVRAAAG